MIDAAEAAPGIPQRIQICQEAERLIVEDAPCIFLGYPNRLALRQPWIRGSLLDSIFPLRFDLIWREPGATPP